MSEEGYVGHVLISADGEPVVPEEPWVYRVREEPGSTAETLTLFDGSRSFPREGLTVFATEEEAREHAQRRIDEAALANFIHSGLQEQEAVEVSIMKLVEVFAPGERWRTLSAARQSNSLRDSVGQSHSRALSLVVSSFESKRKAAGSEHTEESGPVGNSAAQAEAAAGSLP